MPTAPRLQLREGGEPEGSLGGLPSVRGSPWGRGARGSPDSSPCSTETRRRGCGGRPARRALAGGGEAAGGGASQSTGGGGLTGQRTREVPRRPEPTGTLAKSGRTKVTRWPPAGRTKEPSPGPARARVCQACEQLCQERAPCRSLAEGEELALGMHGDGGMPGATQATCPVLLARSSEGNPELDPCPHGACLVSDPNANPWV